MCSAIHPALTEPVWLKIIQKNKVTSTSGDKTKVEFKILYCLIGETSSDPWACFSRKLLVDIYLPESQKRGPRPLHIQPDFTIDFPEHGCYRFADLKEDSDCNQVWKGIKHVSGAEASINWEDVWRWICLYCESVAGVIMLVSAVLKH